MSSAVVLARSSKSFFEAHLGAAGAHSLLLTTGLMAPEAYTVDAVIRAWFAGKSPAEVKLAAASAYHRFQKCGLTGATRLFATRP